MRRTATALLLSGGFLFGGVLIATPASSNTQCTYTIGWYKNHTGFPPGSSGADLRGDLDDALIAYFTRVAGHPVSLADILAQPSRGHADLIAAKQLIATASNGAAGQTGFTGAVGDAFYTLADYFEGERTLTRAELLAAKDVLDAYNNGRLGLPHCA